MKKVLITTVPFAKNNKLPLELLEAAGINYQINPLNKKLTSEELKEMIPEYDAIIAGTEEINIDVLNNAIEKYTPKRYTGKEPIKCLKSECYAYKEGTKVRVALKRDDFRSGDIRWSKKAHTIIKVLLLPNRPIMYMVDGYRNAFYKNELKPYREIEGGKKVVEKYEIEELRKRFKKNGKIFYKVKWKNYRKLTDEPRSSLIRDVPDLVLEFESEYI